MNRILLLLILLALTLLLTSVHAASSATSFCKCVCFNNSTIIALNPPKSSSAAAANNKSPLLDRAASDDSDSGSGSGSNSPGQQHLTCTSCNRAFCLSYKLPICANAREEDVFAQCFQRDSVKDEAVVFIFIFATAGLLVWAVLKPWVVRWTGWGVEKTAAGGRREGRYVPLTAAEAEVEAERHGEEVREEGQRRAG